MSDGRLDDTSNINTSVDPSLTRCQKEETPKNSDNSDKIKEQRPNPPIQSTNQPTRERHNRGSCFTVFHCCPSALFNQLLIRSIGSTFWTTVTFSLSLSLPVPIPLPTASPLYSRPKWIGVEASNQSRCTCHEFLLQFDQIIKLSNDSFLKNRHLNPFL